MTKDQFGLFLSKTLKHCIHPLLRKKTIQDVNLCSGFCNLPWDRGIWFKIVSLRPKLRDLADLLKCETSFIENILWGKQAALVCTDLVNALVKLISLEKVNNCLSRWCFQSFPLSKIPVREKDFYSKINSLIFR